MIDDLPAPVTPTFRPVDDRPGLTVVDPVQNAQYPLETETPVALADVEPEGFHFPVESAVQFSTATLTLPYVVPTVVRDRDGRMRLETEHYANETLPRDEYVLELMAPIRLYVRVESAVTITSSADRLAFDFGEAATVRLGARSHHERPAGTVTTTAEPADLARAVSTFGSALKTLSPERSLPTFRGHPPRIELGEEVRVPAGLEAPDSGVEIVVPEDRSAVYAASPLAYYLGATVRTGPNPRIETDRGFEYPLGDSREAFDRSVERVLKHAFFFDCVTRTEGLYRIDLHERRQLEDRVDLAFDELYDEPLPTQLEAYLSVPFETVDDLLPTWQLVTHATPEPENATALPFLANDLSIVRTAPSAEERAPAEPPSIDVDSFTRSAARPDDGRRHRPAVDSFVSPPDVDAFERAWLGEGIPIGANKLVQAAFENGLDVSPSSDAVEITIVCNDARMVDELDGSLYGDRDELPFDVTVRRNLSVEELRTLLAEETGFLHYVGHVENGAFVCHDGHLDPRTVRDVGVETFLLNGCRSYEIGMHLLEAGSVGGIVTLSEIGNPDAVAVGRLIARLLNAGFTLRSAVDVARAHRLVGNQYVVVGQGGAAVAQSGGGVPNVCRIESIGRGGGDGGSGGDGTTTSEREARRGTACDPLETASESEAIDATGDANPNPDSDSDSEDVYRIRLRLYPCAQAGMGALYIPYIDGIDRYFLVGGDLPPIDLSGSIFSRFLRLEQIPVERDGTLYWSVDDHLSIL